MIQLKYWMKTSNLPHGTTVTMTLFHHALFAAGLWTVAVSFKPPNRKHVYLDRRIELSIKENVSACASSASNRVDHRQRQYWLPNVYN